MSSKYTNKTLPDDPSMFPKPATWMSWVREGPRRQVKRDASGDYVRTYDKEGRPCGYEYEELEPWADEGKVRHHYTRGEARKSLMWLGKNTKYRPESERGRFCTDWAVYEWVAGEYGGRWVLRGRGVKGELRSENPFFSAKQSAEDKVHPFEKAQHDRAIQSILQAVN